MLSVQSKSFDFIGGVVDTASKVSHRILETAPFIILRNPGVQTACGLLALGFGISQVYSGAYLCRVGLSLGGIILYHVERK